MPARRSRDASAPSSPTPGLADRRPYPSGGYPEPRRSGAASGLNPDQSPWLCHLFADGSYTGQKLEAALARLGRWIERTVAWLNRNRALAKDFEGSFACAEAWIMIASVRLISRRLVRA